MERQAEVMRMLYEIIFKWKFRVLRRHTENYPLSIHNCIILYYYELRKMVLEIVKSISNEYIEIVEELLIN